MGDKFEKKDADVNQLTVFPTIFRLILSTFFFWQCSLAVSSRPHATLDEEIIGLPCSRNR